MDNLKVMVADDDKNICELLRLYLEKENLKLTIVNDGASAVRIFKTSKFDLLILDIMMPIKDGFEVCEEIRKFSSCPIIMLTAKDQVFDKVKAFEIGADDYVVKPFEMKEMMARIKAVLRRCDSNISKEQIKKVEYDKLSIDLSTYNLVVNNEKIDTPPKQMELLYYLASNPNKVFSRNKLLDEVWGFDYFGDTRTVDVHIKRLREKLHDTSPKWELKTVWGVGYKFELKE